MTVPAAWMPPAKIDRIIVHWTAGAHQASDLDRAHYHILVEASGKLVRGVPSITLNQYPAKAGYAAHTLNCNSGSIGVSVCCMAGAIEQPYSSGKAPMSRVQWDVMMTVIADLCRFYRIPVTSRTVLSHAEVQGTLGIKQRGKWDIARLSFDPAVRGAKSVGDRMRLEVSLLLAGVIPAPVPLPVPPVPPRPLPPDVPAPPRPVPLQDAVPVPKPVDDDFGWDVHPAPPTRLRGNRGKVIAAIVITVIFIAAVWLTFGVTK